MKLLLVNTPISIPDILGEFTSLYDDLKMVPTGISYLASYARNAGIEVKVLDQYAECLSIDKIFKLIENFKPDLIGYGATTPNYCSAIHLVRQIRKRFPNILTVMGGQHPSIFPEETLKNDAVDFIIRDEGEESLVSLCHIIEEKGDFKSIRGLSYKLFSEQIHNEKSNYVNVDALPFPAYDLLPMHCYSSPSYTKFASPCYQMIASRGCPFHCSYCINAELNISARYRKRNVDSVIKEMELLVDKYGAKQIQFWDPIFPLGHKHAIEFCEKVIEQGLHKKIVWNSTTRAETLTEETIKMMAKSGCKGIGFGIESGNQELLESVKKKVDFDKVRDVCKIARKNGIVVTGSFILGFPGETSEMAQRTIDFAKSLDIHYAQFSIMVPYPGTPLYRELVKKEEVKKVESEKDFLRFNQSIGLTELEPIFVPEGWTIEELKTIQKRAYTEFFLRPKMIWMHLPHINIYKLFGMIRSFMTICGLVIQRLLKQNSGD